LLLATGMPAAAAVSATASTATAAAPTTIKSSWWGVVQQERVVGAAPVAVKQEFVGAVPVAVKQEFAGAAPVAVKREFAGAAPVAVKQERVVGAAPVSVKQEFVGEAPVAVKQEFAGAAAVAAKRERVVPAAIGTGTGTTPAATDAANAFAGAATTAAITASDNAVAGQSAAKKARAKPTWWFHMKDTEVRRLTLPIEVLRLANALSDTRDEIALRENVCATSDFLEREVRDVLLVTDRTFTNDEEEHRMYMELRASAEAVKAAVYRSLDGIFLDIGNTDRAGGRFHDQLIQQATQLCLTFSGAESAMHVPDELDLPDTDEAYARWAMSAVVAPTNVVNRTS